MCNTLIKTEKLLCVLEVLRLFCDCSCLMGEFGGCSAIREEAMALSLLRGSARGREESRGLKAPARSYLKPFPCFSSPVLLKSRGGVAFEVGMGLYF